jgi:hypothetical protein
VDGRGVAAEDIRSERGPFGVTSIEGKIDE